MKITALVRSLNEQDWIGRCISNYKWCDRVLVADGGSTDDTVKIAGQFDNVTVRHFDKRLDLPDGSFMNSEPLHLNFLFDWADEIRADWVIIADCDTWPNLALQRKARTFMARADITGAEGLFTTFIYLWGEDQYFPKINQAGPQQWAWRAGLGLRYPTNGNNNFEVVAPGPNKENSIILDKPYVVMHYVSDETRELEKIKRYESWGHPKTHLLESIYAPPEDLPDWIKEYQV